MLDADNIQEPILDNLNENETNGRNSPTFWRVKQTCCCCGPFVELSIPRSKKKRYFLRGWECKPLMPIVVSILILFTTISHFICFFPHQYFFAKVITPIFIFIFLILFVWSYFAAACMDPGYLPYNWVQTKRFSYTWQEQLSGLAVTRSQFNFALTKENRPPKCSFSHSAGRFVIRADHICGWVANWIGKRNHKQFILMNLYGGIFALSLATGPFFVKNFFSLPMKILFTGIIAFSIDLSFAFSLLAMFGQTIIDLAKNRTKLHRMRDEVSNSTQLNDNTELNETIFERKITMKASMQEVCGNGSCLSWLIPLPAFDDSLIIDDDPNEIFQPADDVDIRHKGNSHKHHHHKHKSRKSTKSEESKHTEDSNMNQDNDENLSFNVDGNLNDNIDES